LHFLDLGQGNILWNVGILEWWNGGWCLESKRGSREMVKQKEISKKEKDDIRTLMKFIEIYCRENHNGEKAPFSFKLFDMREIEKKEISLCADCSRLLAYGLTMRLKCPHDPKPMCKKCDRQCYHGEYKAKIREVMKFSGMYMIKHGRVDLLYHYFR
jgi:hypothetical protein